MFWPSGDVCLGFLRQGGPLAWVLRRLRAMEKRMFSVIDLSNLYTRVLFDEFSYIRDKQMTNSHQGQHYL